MSSIRFLIVVPPEKRYLTYCAFNYQRMDVGPAHAIEWPARSSLQQPMSIPALKRSSQRQTSTVTTLGCPFRNITGPGRNVFDKRLGTTERREARRSCFKHAQSTVPRSKHISIAEIFGGVTARVLICVRKACLHPFPTR